MSDREQINLKVGPGVKKEWDDYVTESHVYESLSGLIRASVDKEINGREDQTAESTDKNPQMGEVLDGIRRIEAELDDLQTRMRSVERTTESRPDVMEVASEIYGRLPTEKPGSDKWRAHVNQWTPEQHTIWPGTVKSIAESTGNDESDIRDALDHLRSTTKSHVVRRTEHQGKRRYWRDE